MKNRICLMLSIILFAGCYCKSSALILSGVDTLINANSGSGFKPGFDFIEQKACTTSFDYPGCHNHFLFNLYSYPKWYWHIVIDGGYGAKMGKVNLDSLKTAPSDLEFQKSPARADSIPPDSLASRVGNSYWIKTGNDPRPAWAGVYYAKIRVLNFRVIDSASRKVEMVFLWAYNGTGVRGVTTSGLDTFHFDNTAAQARRGYSGAASLSAGGALKVVGDRFTVPQELVGSGVVLGVYDLRGKRLGRITVGNRKTIDLGAIAGKGRGGIVVVRGE